MYSAVAGPAILSAGQRIYQFGTSLFYGAGAEAYVAGSLTASQAQRLIASSGGRVVTLYTQLTQSPAANRILYAAQNPQLAEQARRATLYAGRIPADLFNRLRIEGLIRFEQTSMNGVVDTATVIEAEAMPLLHSYFQATGGDGTP